MNLSINSYVGSYQVAMHDRQDSIIDLLKSIQNLFCIMDANVIKAHPNFYEKLKTIAPVSSFTATEENKSTVGLMALLTEMQEVKLNKQSNLIVIGGGITQDVCALAAHLYYRGIPYILIPTTLLSMADSCIGSKSSLNFNSYKNQLGSFYPPHKVLICTEFLTSLEQKEIYSGYGEIFKLFIIDNNLDALANVEISAETLEQRHYLTKLIFKALTIKKRFIEEDEFDKGIRRILNYGHTFGHAIEAISQYAMPHGLAVTLGIDIANYISLRLGLLEEFQFKALHQLIGQTFPWNQFVLDTHANNLIKCVKSDKKALSNKITMALLTSSGMVLKPLEIDTSFFDFIQSYVTHYMPTDIKAETLE